MQNAQTLLALSRRDIRYLARRFNAGYSSHCTSSPAGAAESFRRICGYKPKQGKTRLDKTKQAFSEKVFFFHALWICKSTLNPGCAVSQRLCFSAVKSSSKIRGNRVKTGRNRLKKLMPKSIYFILTIDACVLDCGGKHSAMPLLVFGASPELGCWRLEFQLPPFAYHCALLRTIPNLSREKIWRQKYHRALHKTPVFIGTIHFIHVYRWLKIIQFGHES